MFLTFEALLALIVISDAFVACGCARATLITARDRVATHTKSLLTTRAKFHFCAFCTEPPFALLAVIKHMGIAFSTSSTVVLQAFIARVLLMPTTRKVDPALILAPIILWG